MPFRAPDPHNLRNAALKVGVIEDDRECPGCGYNLRGLPLQTGGRCPECGMITVASSRAPQIDDPLSLAPTRVILAFIRGCWAASILVGLAIGLNLARRFPDVDADFLRAALLGVSLLWCGAVIWLTPAFDLPQAASRGFSRRGRMRRAARWLQLGWPLASGLRLIQALVTLATPVSNMVGMLATLAVAAGLVGVVILSILLERLAEWARDDRAEHLFNWAVWAIPLTTLLLLVDLPLPMVNLLFGLLWLIGIGLFPYGLLSLSGSVTLSVVHAHEHRQREQRRAERQHRYDQQVAKTVQKMDAERAKRGHA